MSSNIILGDDGGHRGRMKSSGMAPKNHMKDNLAAIRDAQRKNREKAAIEAVHEDERFKLKQFDQAESRVKSQLRRDQERAAASDRSPEDAKFLRAHVREDKMELRAQEVQGKVLKKERVRKKSMLPVEAANPNPVEVREARNFQKENARKVIHTKPSSAGKENPAKTKDYGKVPKYLRQRQQELAQEEEIRQELANMDMDCPEGMRLLPEAERVDTLKILENNRGKVTTEIGAMPFVIDTLGLRKRKQALENKLKEIDEAIKIFSRRKVYVEM